MSDTLVECVRELFVAYGKGDQIERAQVYCAHLADLELAEVSRAIATLIRTAKQWLPTVAEIRELVAEEGCDLEVGELAWAEVLRQVRVTGRYRTPYWSSAAMERAVAAIGGWQVICDSTEPSIIRAQFIKAYSVLRTRQVHELQTGDAARLNGGVDIAGLLRTRRMR